MNSAFKKTIKLIVAAQYNSDAAKGINIIPDKYDMYKNTYYYDAKDKCILAAINLINSTSRSGINYYVVEQLDQNGHKSRVVYFDIKYNDLKYQISFHSFSGAIKKLVGKGRPTRWTKELAGSRDACLELIRLVLGGEK